MATDQPDSFGERLRDLREQAGLTQEELAEQAGLSAQAVGALERGGRQRPYPNTVRSLAAALGLAQAEGEALVRQVRVRAGAPKPLSPDDAPRGFTVPPTPIFGRERVRAEIGALLQQSELRLVTLTGPGGVGKTRLAAEVVTDSVTAFPDHVAISLVPLSDPALVVSTIAKAFEIRESPRRSVRDALHVNLAGKRVLLLLDNFEHVLPAAPEIGDLIASCPDLKLLVTSRTPLRLRGEQEFPVPPLDVPEADGPGVSADQAGAFAAIVLFVARARAVNPSFSLTDQNVSAVAEICRRLDGLPLAIELAAARTKLFTPDALRARLQHRLSLLTGGARDLPDRQRTMRDAIAWSFGLCTHHEQALFRHLAVFAGGATLEAIEAVAGEPSGDHGAVLDTVTALVDHSLLVQEYEPSGAPRFGMLETIREYALEQLDATPEASAVRDAHASYFLALAERADAQLLGPSQAAWLNRLETEHDNLRAALAWADDRQQGDTLVRLAGELARFWRFHWHGSEGQRWLERALTWGDGAPTAWRAKALLGSGVMANMRRDYSRAEVLHREALAIYRGLGDRWATARALLHLGEAIAGQGGADQARLIFEESLALFRELGEKPLAALVLKNLGQLAKRRGDPAGATALLEDALALSREAGFAWGRAETLMLLAEVVRDRGDQTRATGLFAEALSLYAEQGDKEGMALAVGALAAIAREWGRPEGAARLFGVAAALHESADVGPGASLQGDAAVRASLDGETFAAAFAAGRALTVEQTLAEVTALAAELAAESAPPA